MKDDVDHHEFSSLHALALKLGEWLDRLQPSAEVVALGTSLIVGLGTGLSAVGFNLLIQFVSRVSFEWLPSKVGNARWPILVVPAVGGLIAGPLIYNFAREAKGHGVPEVMQAMALRGGRIRPIVAVIKALASSLSIGTGGSVGREGPIVQIGAALGSTLGQIFHFSDERIRNLVACGAAGGIAATFNAPIAGVVFALEIILGELTAGHVGTVVVSAVTASAVMRAVLGAEFAFAVPQLYELESPVEFIFYAVLGVLSAFVAFAFVRTLYGAEDIFDNQPFVPEWLQPAVGGLLLGAVALAYPLLFPELSYQGMPQVFGGGYPPITAALAGQEAIHIALVLMVLKMIATNLTLGSGGSGGVFAPALFMGAMLGEATGQVLGLLFPGIVAPPGAYALVGMGAVFAGSAHAPITAVVMLFELTGDYRIILPLMLTIVVATVIARTLLHDESIYTLKLARRGIHLQRGRDVDVLESVRVDEIMTRDDYAVSTDQTLVDLSETFSHERHHGFPVLDEHGRLWGVVTITDLERAVAANKGRRTPVTEIGTPYNQLLVAFPDDPVGVVLRRMSPRGLGRLPVVSREDPHRLVGMVRRADVIRAYNVALARRSELAHRTRRMQRRHIDGTEFIEVELDDKDSAVGKKVGEVAQEMPDDCILVSINRDGNTLIPHGDTILRTGDRVTAFIRSEYATRLFDCMKSQSDGSPSGEPPPE